MKAPTYWEGGRQPGWTRLLRPVGVAYAAVGRLKRRFAKPYRASVPVICVGNLTVGGVGKTPIVRDIIERLEARGRTPFVITRGYGGRLKGPLRVTTDHDSAAVGDEALLHARAAPVIIGGDRAQSAQLAERQGADVLVMDDGFQNPTLAKDFSFVVIDAARGFGNGQVVPAGPLRETIGEGLHRADALLVMGESPPPRSVASAYARFPGPVLSGRFDPIAVDAALDGVRVVAFAGIGFPERFFTMLERIGADVRDRAAFPDHHPFTSDEIAGLRLRAERLDARLVTTAKDLVRLPSRLREDIAALDVHPVFEDPAAFDRLLDTALARGGIDRPHPDGGHQGGSGR